MSSGRLGGFAARMAVAFLALASCEGAALATPLNPGFEEGSSASDHRADERRDVSYSFAAGVPLLAGAIASVVLPGKLLEEPPACQWCGGSNPNAVDRWARKAKWDNPCRAARWSYGTLGAAGLAALVPMSYESEGREWLENVGGVVDSVAVTMMLTQIVKYTVRRERPAASSCHPGREAETDRNLSFFSGHSSIAFALVSSAHEMSRLRGRPRDEWLWVGAASAAATGYLRVAGDRHHLIDVLAGAGVGYLVGKWVPRHFNRVSRSDPMNPRTSMADPLPGPAGLATPLFSYAKPGANGDRVMLLQLGKGPGKSLQFGLSF